MEFKKAEVYVDQLASLAKFPSRLYNPGAVATIQEIVASICKTPQEADDLVAEITRRFNEWPGTATLRTVHDELFPPPEQQYRTPEWRNQPKPVIACGKCLDLGWLPSSLSICECPAGKTSEAARDLAEMTETARVMAEARERAKNSAHRAVANSRGQQ